MFLEKILLHKLAQVSRNKKLFPRAELDARILECHPTRDFKKSLTGGTINLIAEIKKASPSKGLLCQNFDPQLLASTYENSGAAAISVLTEDEFFLGSLDYLQLVKKETSAVPVLRKDFIIDSYQLVEARVYGADAVLLIAAALSKKQLQEFINETLRLSLVPLVEVHNREELELAMDCGAEVIGINNRNLATFKVSLDVTYQLMKSVPGNVVVVSESGINSRLDLLQLAEVGVKAVLVGEAIVKAADPATKIKELLGEAS